MQPESYLSKSWSCVFTVLCLVTENSIAWFGWNSSRGLPPTETRGWIPFVSLYFLQIFRLQMVWSLAKLHLEYPEPASTCSHGAWPVPVFKWLCINSRFRKYWVLVTGVCRTAIMNYFISKAVLYQETAFNRNFSSFFLLGMRLDVSHADWH